MSIKSISIQNFKTFKELDINLSNFNVMIGANASGKSNFIQIFKFLRAIVDHGIENAVSMQGGSKYIRNTTSKSKNLFLKVILDQSSHIILGYVNEEEETESYVYVNTEEIIYELNLNFKTSEKFSVNEQVTLHGKLFIGRMDESIRDEFENAKNKSELYETNIIIKKEDNGITVNFNIPDDVKTKFKINEESFFIKPFRKIHIDRNSDHDTLLNVGMIPFFVSPPINSFFKGISIYDFDPKLPKKAVSITGRRDLEEDGSNLSNVIKSIISSPKDKKKLLNLIKDSLPFVDDLKVNSVEGKYLSLSMCEVFNKKEYLPASLLSDGTINITALLIALYFVRNPFIVLEEPERNMHPHLMSKVVSLLQDASSKKQIFVTTHNPEIIKHVELENILFVYRDEEGCSQITKPQASEDVMTFIKNNIGLDELFINNSLW